MPAQPSRASSQAPHEKENHPPTDDRDFLENEVEAECDKPSYNDLRPSSFKLLMEKTLAESEDAESFSTPAPEAIEAEFLDYMTIKFAKDSSETSLAFWLRNSVRFPKLYRLALTLIAIQASSGESERVFSVSGWHTSGKKTG